MIYIYTLTARPLQNAYDFHHVVSDSPYPPPIKTSCMGGVWGLCQTRTFKTLFAASPVVAGVSIAALHVARLSKKMPVMAVTCLGPSEPGSPRSSV